ncbi:MAG: 2TM domain-containing protein [Cocleimonas sp.]|nr:2TM domain-containing protein [Cocleimonas sp.]
MIVHKLRLQRGWSQEQLAEFSDLSVRTIQRIEKGQKASLESLKSLAAVFELQVSDLQESEMKSATKLSMEEKAAFKSVQNLKSFYSHLITYVIVIILLFIVNFTTSADYIWAVWPALGWGIGVISHGLRVFEVFDLLSPEWEKKQIEKKLERKG